MTHNFVQFCACFTSNNLLKTLRKSSFVWWISQDEGWLTWLLQGRSHKYKVFQMLYYIMYFYCRFGSFLYILENRNVGRVFGLLALLCMPPHFKIAYDWSTTSAYLSFIFIRMDFNFGGVGLKLLAVQ